MGARLPFSFEEINFGSGELGFYMNTCDEETPLLAHIKYPNRFDIIVEHHSEKRFTASIFWDIGNHCPPVAVYSTADLSLLEKTLAEAVKRTEREAEERRFSYYGPLWETEFIEIND